MKWLVALGLLTLLLTGSVEAACRCSTCPRDAHGRILRSAKAVREFKRLTGFPLGRPGWVVDHIKPLECGGKDAPANMQWQTVQEAKAKDRMECDCSRWVK
jgi:hypothetical protein